MRREDRLSATVRAVEALVLEKFQTEPFHNLRLLYGEQLSAAVAGGTCSDKTLSFLGAAARAGFEVYLHSAFIDREEKHRLARVHIDGRVFFADVGDGWPALKLYPADREVAFRCFGIGFRTKIVGSRLFVFCERHGRETLQLEIEVHGKPESDIRADIERRFTSGITYPFSNSLRFSLVVGDRFLFLRGDQLQVYGEGSFEEVTGLALTDVPAALRQYFGFDVGPSLTASRGES
jgi:arylamine N-acetyltransferase